MPIKIVSRSIRLQKQNLGGCESDSLVILAPSIETRKLVPVIPHTCSIFGMAGAFEERLNHVKQAELSHGEFGGTTGAG